MSLQTTIYSSKGEKAGTANLPEAVFSVPLKKDALRQVILAMLANKRAGTAHTKFRSEVSGTGKKPWKQKGTGNARHGSKRSPIWVGGGVSHGPRSEKDYTQKINSKQKLKALGMVLTIKLAEKKVLFVDKVSLTEAKTKKIVELIGNLQKIDSSFETLATKTNKNNVLFVLPTESSDFYQSARNLPFVKVTTTRGINALSASTSRFVIFVDTTETLDLLDARIKNGLAKKADKLVNQK